MSSKPGSNEPCWCGSGRKYKQCHRAVDEAPRDRKYAEAQRVYASNWRVTAEAQYARGDYQWMARQLAPYGVKRILDVGCGSGHGVLALIEELGTDLRIVAIDENPSCLISTRETLAGAKREAGVIKRVTTLPSREAFRSEAQPVEAGLPEPIALVEGDVCSDPEMQAALERDGPFDAVTIWLSGVHMLRQFHEVVVGAGIDSDYRHRLFVQNAVYELADTVLRPGGVLQVVDRGEKPDTALLQQDLMRAHREQAEPTSLDVRVINHAPWTQPDTKRVPMVMTAGTSGRQPGGLTAMISVISVKT